MATSRKTTVFDVAPTFGASKKKPTAWAGGLGNSIQSALANNPAVAARAPAPTFAPTPSAPAAQSPAGLPVDPLYDQQIAGLGKTKGDTLAELTRQRQAGLLGYGYNATYDDKGLVQGLAYDPNNPYSQAALARTVYQQSKTGTNNSMAARGQLYSGALVNAQNQNDTGFNVGESSRQTALTNFLNGLTGQEKIARDAYDTGSLQAEGDRLGRAPTNPNYNPATPEASAPAGPSTADLIKQWQANPVKTTYTNAQGHPVRVYGDGHKEVSTDGGKTWRRV